MADVGFRGHRGFPHPTSEIRQPLSEFFGFGLGKNFRIGPFFPIGGFRQNFSFVELMVGHMVAQVSLI
jgi:hypothetical protein